MKPRSIAARVVRRRTLDVAVLIGCIGSVMFLSWRVGADACWDTLSYHLYTPYLLLDHRWTRDIYAIGLEGFLNPLVDIPFYLALIVWRVPPIWIGLAVGAVQGAGVWCMYKLVSLFWPADERLWSTVAGIAAAVVAMFGATFYMEIGSHMNDVTLSGLLAASLVIFIAGIRDDGRVAMRPLVLAAALAGFVVGAKLVMTTSVAGFAAAIAIGPGSVRERLRRLAAFGIAFVIGFLIADGYWMWLMWRHEGHPLFPFLDRDGGSPIAEVIRGDAATYKPRDVLQWLFYPFFLATEQRLASEGLIRDARFAAAYVAVVAFLATAVGRWRRTSRVAMTQSDYRIVALMAFVIGTYLLWEMRSSYYRYAVLLEMLAGVTVIGSVAFIARRSLGAAAVIVPVCVLLIVFTRSADAGRLPWSSNHFGVDPRYLEGYRDATVLIVDRPIGYVIPYFPSSTSFIRIANNLFLDGPATRDAIDRRLQSVDRRRVYLLDVTVGRSTALKTLELDRLGLTVDESKCQPFSTFVDSGRICLVRFLSQ